MTSSGTGDRILRGVAHVIAEIGERMWQPDGCLIPGASLLMVTYCRAHGVPLEDDDVIRLADFLQMNSKDLKGVVRFHDRALETSAGQGPITFCRGVNCSMHGADHLSKQILAGLRRQGFTGLDQEVHCLGHCEQGPSIRLCRETYCGREQAIVADQRQWRGDDPGHVLLGDDSIPVRD